MLLCLDENISRKLKAAMNPVFRPVRFTTVSEQGLTSAKDPALIEELGKRGVSGIVSLDQMLLVRPEEREALRSNNMHWIGLPYPSGRRSQLHAQIASSVIHGLQGILEQGFPGEPHLYYLNILKENHLEVRSERI